MQTGPGLPTLASLHLSLKATAISIHTLCDLVLQKDQLYNLNKLEQNTEIILCSSISTQLHWFQGSWLSLSLVEKAACISLSEENIIIYSKCSYFDVCENH